MEKIVILNFGTSDIKIHIYNVDLSADIDWDYIKTLGFDPDECIWYFATNIDIKKHKEILK